MQIRTHTSALIMRDLFPRLSRKCSGDSMGPKSRRSPYLSLSVSVVAEIPASGPRLGREPAVTEGSGICPGIVSDSVVTTAEEERPKAAINSGGCENPIKPFHHRRRSQYLALFICN